VRQRQIGAALSASELCLGTMFFGTRVDEATSFAILDRFAVAGGTFIDTANCYAFWIEGGTGEESEPLIGRWLRRRGDRDRFVIATKVGSRPEPPAGAPWPDSAEGLSAEVIRAQVQASLRRLGTDHIDLYYAHIDDPKVAQEETLGAFNDLVTAGAVRVLGCSNHTTDRLISARRTASSHGWPMYQCVQQRHTYLTPAPDADFGAQIVADDELFEYGRGEDDLTLLAYSPLLSGSYVRADRPIPPEYRHPGTADRLAALHEVADSLGATPNQVVLAWLLGGDPPVLPVIGVSSVAQLDECLRAVDLRLDEPHRYRLDAAGQRFTARQDR
jgi:aryl-alcohol dehydrogenase-like predicted oxidoreductase